VRLSGWAKLETPTISRVNLLIQVDTYNIGHHCKQIFWSGISGKFDHPCCDTSNTAIGCMYRISFDSLGIWGPLFRQLDLAKVRLSRTFWANIFFSECYFFRIFSSTSAKESMIFIGSTFR
jgi:hypothetical protein